MTGRLFSIADSFTLNYGQPVTKTYQVIPEIAGRGLLRSTDYISLHHTNLLKLHPQSNNLSGVSRIILTVDGNEMVLPLVTLFENSYIGGRPQTSKVPIPFSSSLSLSLVLLAEQSSSSTVTYSFSFVALVYLFT
ncbi:MAG: hypothetical protein QXT91_00605 [Candidatus Caldarchaeum sp.]